MNEQRTNEWMNERTNEWMNEWNKDLEGMASSYMDTTYIICLEQLTIMAEKERNVFFKGVQCFIQGGGGGGGGALGYF